jgi:hypothetical protein
MMTTRFGTMVAMGIGLVGLVNCDGCKGKVDYQANAFELIHKQESDFGLGKLDPKCTAVPTEMKVGDVFKCSALTTDKKELFFDVTLQKENFLFVKPTNVLSVEAAKRAVIAPEYEKKTGKKVQEANIDCGSKVIVYTPNLPVVISCLVTDGSGAKNKVTTTIDKAKDTIETLVTKPDGSPLSNEPTETKPEAPEGESKE